MPAPEDVYLISAYFKLFKATLGALAVFLTLRFFDWVTGAKWNAQNTLADRGAYYGLRFLGVCILYGWVIS